MIERTTYDEYLALPKKFGDVNSDVLVTLSREHERQADIAPSLQTAVKQYSIAGSSLVEAMLVLEDPNHQYDEYRLDNLNRAWQLLTYAEQDAEVIIERGLQDPNDQVVWLRTTLATKFINLYEDMVVGKIEEATVVTLQNDLKKILDRVKSLSKEPRIRQRFKNDLWGLRAELIVFRNAWGKYKETGDIVIPSSYRGGDGSQRKDETHDVVFLKQHPDSTLEVIEDAEIKSKTSDLDRQAGNIGRYTCTLLVVNPHNGQVERIPSTRQR